MGIAGKDGLGTDACDFQSRGWRETVFQAEIQRATFERTQFRGQNPVQRGICLDEGKLEIEKADADGGMFEAKSELFGAKLASEYVGDFWGDVPQENQNKVSLGMSVGQEAGVRAEALFALARSGPEAGFETGAQGAAFKKPTEGEGVIRGGKNLKPAAS
jgi:hypothetical protein